TIVAWVRSEARARQVLGGDVELVRAAGPEALAAAVVRAEAIVNLAGEPVIGRRWTAERRRVLEASRIGVTRDLVSAIAAASPRPRVLVSGSAVGWYGDRGDERLTESSPPGDDFLARLCRRWEEAARGGALHRPAVLPMPAFALRLIFGEAASVLLASQRAEPRVLLANGFTFAFPDLDGALADILAAAPAAAVPAARSL